MKTLTCLIVTLALSAKASERKVKEGDVPKPVIESVKKKYPQAILVQFEQEDEDGRLIYGVEIKDAGRAIDVDLSPDGKIVEESWDIPVKDLPTAVRKGSAASKYGKWAIRRAEKVVIDEKLDTAAFEVVVKLGKKAAEVALDATGKITAEEADDDKDGSR